jgi:type IV secretion system protein VirB5
MIKLKQLLSSSTKDSSNRNKLSENPYLNARRAWNTHTAGLMQSLHLWQLVGIGSLLITITAVGGLISIGSQSKFVPLVFQQDASGNTLSVTRADKVGHATMEDFRLAAANFIENLRMVSIDAELQKKTVYQVYSFLHQNDAALLKVQEFYNATQTNPFERASREIVSIDIKSVIQESNNTWQVDWIETIRTLEGESKDKPQAMKALLTLYQQQDSKDMENESILKNPHLIFIKDFHWTKEIKIGS